MVVVPRISVFCVLCSSIFIRPHKLGNERFFIDSIVVAFFCILIPTIVANLHMVLLADFTKTSSGRPHLCNIVKRETVFDTEIIKDLTEMN